MTNIKLKDVRYTALFVDNPEMLVLMFPPAHSRILADHSTNWFGPTDLVDLEIGRKVMLKVTGRVQDEKSDVLLVENPKSKNRHPHVTISTAEGVESAYSNELIEKSLAAGSVEVFDAPLFIEATEGYADFAGKVFFSDVAADESQSPLDMLK